MEGDAADRPKRSAVKVFQSTPSAWRETHYAALVLVGADISIHSLRMEGDKRNGNNERNHVYFNPLPPHGGRLRAGMRRVVLSSISIHSLRMEGDTGDTDKLKQGFGISIHSLRMEGDRVFGKLANQLCDFNPLPPHGGRPQNDLDDSAGKAFQSTPSAWRETAFLWFYTPSGTYFNPLPPHGGRLACASVCPVACPFQSTPSAWRETVL